MEDFVTKELIGGLKGIQNTIDPRQQDFAYLAGLIDAEGCFRVKSWLPKGKPNRVFAISLQIGNTKYPIFPWLMQRFGGSVCYTEATKHKPFAVWSIASVKLYDLLPSLYPFLRSKKDVCRKLMEFQETVLPDGGDRHSEEFKTRYSKILKTREDIVNEIHKLNTKGE